MWCGNLGNGEKPSGETERLISRRLFCRSCAFSGGWPHLEKAFVVYFGEERDPLSKTTEAIGLRELSNLIAPDLDGE